MRCSKCQYEYEGNFCPNCGTPSVQKEKAKTSKKYCTNCGEPIHGGICLKCGVKNNTSHRYCLYCGTQMNDKAVLCVNCHESIRGNIFVRILAIVALCLTPIWLLIVVLGSENLLDVCMILVATALMVLLALPCGSILVKRVTHKKRWLRAPIYLLCFVLSFLLAVVGPLVLSEISHESSAKTTIDSTDVEDLDSSAIKAATAVLQNELKNPYSLQVHNASVTLIDIDDEHNPSFTVELDYSAQNGFGGMNRDVYTVKLVYKIEEGKFFHGNTRINID